MKFAQRLQEETTPNALSRRLSELRESGQDIIDFTESNPTRCEFEALGESVLAPLSEKENLRYEPEPRGLRETRVAIQEYYAARGIRVKPDDIFVTASSSESYHFIFRLLFNPNDAILIPKPGYPLMDYLSQLNDVQATSYTLSQSPSQQWRMNIQEIEQSLTSNTKALLIINPNNPTGHYASPDEFDSIAKLACTKQLAIIADEVFFDFYQDIDLTSRISFANNNACLTFTLGGVSKMLGLPQMKLSWIILSGPDRLKHEVAERLELLGDTYLSANTPAQRAFPYWLKHMERIQKEIRVRVSNNYQTLKKLAFNNAHALPLQGGWNAVLQLSQGADDENLCLRLLEKHHLYVHPGYLFDFPKSEYLVLSLILPPRQFKEGAHRLAEAL